MPLLPTVARWANFFEKYVVSLLFLKIAFDRGSGLRALGKVPIASLGATGFAAATASLLTVLFALFFGLSLLVNRRPLRNPERWVEITIPLVATFVLYAFSAMSPHVPEFATRNLLPPSLQWTAAIAAIPISLVGYGLLLWSVLWLGRSLSIVVSVRTLVSGGPYRFVRHPMYLGYIVLITGMLVAAPSIFSALLLLTYLLLSVWRARLEESALCAFSADYRAYAARTGFLFPTVGRFRAARGA